MSHNNNKNTIDPKERKEKNNYKKWTTMKIGYSLFQKLLEIALQRLSMHRHAFTIEERYS